MKRALCLIRSALIYRRDVFVKGLCKVGYSVQDAIPDPTENDVLVIWNRYGVADDTAKRYERIGAKVIVCENGYLGKNWNGDTWIAMALGHHAGAGSWVEGGAERWDRLDVEMLPFRQDGEGLLILGQRGIGEDGVASPMNWAESVQRRYGGRIRRHPGNAPTTMRSLEEDLEGVESVATWHSAAALKALVLGVPVWYAFPKWIGAGAAKPLALYRTKVDGKMEAPRRSAEDRLQMFRRLAWAQWRLDSEIGSGEAFDWVLSNSIGEPIEMALPSA